MNTSNRILGLLYDREGEFVGLGELGVAQAARRKRAWAELEQRGHRLEFSPAGVRLVRPTALDAFLIERNLPVEQIGKHVICFGEVGSTNDVAFASAEQAGGQALVVTAEAQRAGRGRLGRTWQSPRGANILASVLLPRAARALPHEALTVAAGLAVAEGIEQATGVAAGLKWPNDVIIEGAKVAGILVEIRGAGKTPARRADGTSATRAGEQRVLGMGINVLAAPARAAVRRPAIALAEVVGGGAALERIEILRAVLACLDGWLARLARGGVAELHERWLSRCAMLNQRLTVETAAPAGARRRLTGRVVDISPLEGLLLVTDDGRQHYLPAAVTSINDNDQ